MYHEDRLSGGRVRARRAVGRVGARRRGRRAAAPRPRGADGRQGRGARLPRHRRDARSDQRRRRAARRAGARPSASCSGSRSPDAAHQSLHAAVLQRARGARRRRRASRSLVLAVTAWQVVRVVRLSRYKTELNTAIKRDRNETESPDAGSASRSAAGWIRRSWPLVAAAAKEANDLIEQRTFSWTALFNQLEATLPDDVMLIGVQPGVQGRRDAGQPGHAGAQRRRHRRVLGSPREDRRVPRHRVERRRHHRGRPAPHPDDGGLHAAGRAPRPAWHGAGDEHCSA